MDALRMIPTRLHGILDYLIGILLIASPWLFGSTDAGIGMWLPIILGAGVIVYSLITDYEMSVARILPMTAHLGLDVAGGLLLAVLPGCSASPKLSGFRTWSLVSFRPGPP